MIHRRLTLSIVGAVIALDILTKALVARWMFVGVAVMGLVFTILPGKPEPS